SKREMSILRRISAGVVRLGRKIISMNAEFLDEEQVIRITDEEFVAIKRDDLAGNFDLKLTISTAEGDEAKAQQIAFMMQTIGNN
ncbi:chromosome partitioning protein ParB, partial [Acinetobacter baumannii]|nr:chromosome partitioning protein ParB [Acinetobacter baumannii]